MLEWMVLHQIEISLTTMAKWQHILEGENYITGSLVPIAVFRIRRAYVLVYESPKTLAPAKDLAAKLLDAFDRRYISADETRKVTFTGQTDIGFRNRYTGIYPFFLLPQSWIHK